MVASLEERRQRTANYVGPLLPLMSVFFPSMIPEPSGFIASLLLGIIALDVLLALISGALQLYRRNAWRVTFGVSQISLTMLFFVLAVWRVWGANPWLLVFMFILFAVGGYFGYRNRRLLLQEGIAPKTKTGKRIYAVAVAGMFISGTLAIGVGKLLGVIVGGRPAGLILSVVLFVVALAVFSYMQCFWLKIEEPDWKP